MACSQQSYKLCIHLESVRLCIVSVTQNFFKERATFISKYKTCSDFLVAIITVVALKIHKMQCIHILKA